MFKCVAEEKITEDGSINQYFINGDPSEWSCNKLVSKANKNDDDGDDDHESSSSCECSNFALLSGLNHCQPHWIEHVQML